METAARLSINDVIGKIEGYHDYPECRGNAALTVNGKPWYISTADGAEYWWDNAPTIGELREAGYSSILEDTDADDDDTVEEYDIISAFIDAANDICNREEAAYDLEEIERRIDHICDQIDWETQKVLRYYPRDFANEFDIVCAGRDEERDGEELSEEQLREILSRCFSHGENFYGDVLDDLDTYTTD